VFQNGTRNTFEWNVTFKIGLPPECPAPTFRQRFQLLSGNNFVLWWGLGPQRAEVKSLGATARSWLLLALATISASTVARAAETTVCVAVKNANKPRFVTIRGVGWSAQDEITIGDYSCPVIVKERSELPAVVLIRSPIAMGDKERTRLSDIRRRKSKPFFQLLVSGRLLCRLGFDVQFSDDGDVASGNGFGHNGLAYCILESAKVLHLRELE